MNWKSIETNEDIAELMLLFDGFHESCIKEVHFETGTYVDESRTMQIQNRPVLRILLQRAVGDPEAIELEFSKGVETHLKSSAMNHENRIFGASFYASEDGIWWADQVNWKHTDDHRDDAGWVKAKALRWRGIRDGLGSPRRYR